MSISVSTGIASGIDYEAIIEASLEVEQVKIDDYETKKEGYETEISALGEIKSDLSELQDAIEALADEDDFFDYSVSSSDEDILTVSVTGAPASGTYSLEVTQVATPEILVGSSEFSSKQTNIGGGTLSIAVGSGDAVEIDIDSSTSTLADIIDYINDADAGVTASIMEVSDGAYALALTADENGQSISFSISDSDGVNTDTTGLSSLYADAAAESMTVAQDAAMANYTMGGIDFESSSNEIDGLIEGVTINLKSAEVGTEVTFQVEADMGGTTEKIQAVVDAYNDFVDTISLYQDEGDEESYGVLFLDSTTNRLKSRVQSLLFSEVENGDSGVNYISRLGVEMGDDGYLTFDEGTAEEEFGEDPDAVKTFFTADDIGFAAKMNTTLDSYLDWDGILNSKMDGLGESVTRIEEKIETLEEKLDLTEERLRTRYAALETLLSELTGTQSSLDSLLESLDSD